MARVTDQERAVLLERERFLEGRGAPDAPLRIRPEIVASWQRSSASLVNPNEPLPDFQRLGETHFSAIALPVIDHHLEMLVDTRTSLLFADAQGRLIGRWTHDSTLRSSLATSRVEAGFTMAEGIVGTNGVGTVFESGAAVEIKGAEHFSDVYLPFTCVGAPIRHPLTRRIVGVIDVTCRVEDSSPLAMPWVLNLARHIENQLLDQSSVRERALLSAYLQAVRRSQVAVTCLNDEMVISNPDARALLSEADQRQVWSHLRRLGFRTPGTFTPIELPAGRVLMFRAKPVRLDGTVVGAVVEAYEPQSTSAAPHETTPARRPGLDGLVGASDRWVNVCEQALDWRGDRGGIVVVGEPGVGKMAVLRAALGADTVTVVECSLVMLDGPRSWLADLRSRLEDPAGVVVLRHLHLLDDAVAQAVCSLLDRPGDLPRLAATVVSGTGAAPFGPLVDRIQDHRLEIPPLRHRVDDVPLLLACLASRGTGVGPRWLPDTVGLLSDQVWPDNVRGLAALVRRVTRKRTVGVVSPSDLPDEMSAPRQNQRALSQLERLERQEIMETLASVGGNKVHAAAKLNLARSTLYRKMAALGIPHVPPGGRTGR